MPSFFDKTQLIMILLRIPCVMLAISVHESAHGWAANKLGDPTAKRMGRITLNPAKHFNLMGTLCMVLLGFGWATPVPINVSNFRKPKRDMALSAIAGPISNLLLMLIGMILYRLTMVGLWNSGLLFSMDINVLTAIRLFFSVFISLNAALAIFNLIPVPPLDGSRLLTAFLPLDKYYKVMQYEQYMMIALMVLIFTGAFGGILSTVTGALIGSVESLLDLIPFLRIGG